jgi:adenosylcobinamide kinase/adenosylcobinamide-phosphate guanylyltransferase
MITLVLGGARSGKSRHAQELARAAAARPVYLATSRRWDDDHAARIARHRADRGPEWETIEEERAIARADLAGRVVVVDCVTLWLTNVLMDAESDAEAAWREARGQIAKLAEIDATWVVVSNELGMAPHAETPLGRRFVDMQGMANQALAAAAERVVLMVAGIAMPVKGPRP